MKYVIFGAGGTGGMIGFNMSKNGKDVTIIARNEHLKAMREKGLTLKREWNGTEETIPVNAVPEDEYRDTPDVIFVCVKYYSLDSVVPFIRRTAGSETIVLPILNVFGTGSRLQEKLPDVHVLDGCIYVSAKKGGPGVVVQDGNILRVVYGERNGKNRDPRLKTMEKDMRDSDIEPVLTEHVQRDCLAKFSYVSPIGAAGLYFDAAAGDFQHPGKERDVLEAMMQEISALADGMGCSFDKDYVSINFEILSRLAPTATTSMQRDVLEGRQSEIDGLVYEVVRLGKKYKVPMPVYTRVAEALREKYPEQLK